MDLATYRRSRDLTQEQVATELGLAASSKGWIADIENNRRDASLRLALKIEKWSEGKVKATSLCKIAADLAGKAA